MANIEKINLRGAINALEVGGDALVLPKGDYAISVVRSTSSAITGDTGKRFSVSGSEECITVIRTR